MRAEYAQGGRTELDGEEWAARRHTRDCRPATHRPPRLPPSHANKTQIMETHLLAKTLLKFRSYNTNISKRTELALI